MHHAGERLPGKLLCEGRVEGRGEGQVGRVDLAGGDPRAGAG